ncbi:MAG: hypothetical protein QFX33_02225 [Candidatus Nezhaarchaeota archaeon]|nr:hypothetical protein [Candidatus Nezhaarchaeota archaeon]
MEDLVVKASEAVNCRGQARIIEAVIALILILTVFSASFFMIFSSQSTFRQEAVDLNRLAYNTLHRLAESKAIEETVENGRLEQLGGILQEILPRGVSFQLAIYNVSGNKKLLGIVGRVQGSGEVASATVTYTSRSGNIYSLTLQLARTGQGT